MHRLVYYWILIPAFSAVLEAFPILGTDIGRNLINTANFKNKPITPPNHSQHGQSVKNSTNILMLPQVGLTKSFLLVSPLLSNTNVSTKHSFLLPIYDFSLETKRWSVWTAVNAYFNWVIWQMCFREADNLLVPTIVCEDQNLTGQKVILFCLIEPKEEIFNLQSYKKREKKQQIFTFENLD